MNCVSRRLALRASVISITPLFIGCTNLSSQEVEEISPRLRIYPQRKQTETGWEMTVRVRNVNNWDSSIHDVTVVAFNAHGQEICQAHMGDFLQHGQNTATETVNCDGFPAIVTATARETPCDGAKIRIIYYISEKNPEDLDTFRNQTLWEGRWRECDEEFPPDHILEKVQQSGAATTTRSD